MTKKININNKSLEDTLNTIENSIISGIHNEGMHLNEFNIMFDRDMSNEFMIERNGIYIEDYKKLI